MNNRQKGLQGVRKVKKYLESLNYTVEGPGYSVAFFQGGMRPIHKDYFSCFDLLSTSQVEPIKGHQICSKENKQRNAKKILAKKLSGFLWCLDKGGIVEKYWVSQDEGIVWEENVKI